MSDSRMYPSGVGAPQARPIKASDGTPTWVQFDVVKHQRTHATVAQVNAGLTLLPALPGVKWRLVDITQIAVGGAAGAATTVDLTAVQGGSTVKLLATAIAALTQSAVVRAGGANATVLANGASFVANDANTAVSASKTGSAITTATHIDYLLSYVAEKA